MLIYYINMSNDVKRCFELFVEHIRATTKQTIPEYDINNMDIQDFITQTNILYMQYILSNYVTVSSNSITVVAYEHLKKIIDEYCNNRIYILLCENEKLKQEVSDLEIIISELTKHRS
jgi:hypothetical protein